MPRTVVIDPELLAGFHDSALPPTAEHQVRVKTRFSYLSAGTELASLNLVPGKERAVRGGKPLGYSLSGVVLETGSSVSHVRAGDRVACVGAGAYHSDEVLMAKNLVTKLPEGLSFEESAPAAMMCFALEGFRKPHPELGEHILVVGAGLMGQFVAQFASRFGSRTILLDKNETRLAKAPREIRTLRAGDDCWYEIRAAFAPQGVEIAYFCFGGDATKVFEQVRAVMTLSPDGVPQGRMAFPGGARITVDLASSSGNLQLLSSAKAGPGYRDPVYESGQEYPVGYVKWSPKRNVAFLLEEVHRGRLQVKPLLTHVFPFKDAAAAYRKLAEPNTDALAVLLDYA